MNKFKKTALLFTMAAVMTMQMPVYAATGASQTNLNENETVSDTSSINLYKNYLDETGASDNKSPAEDFVVTVENYSTTVGTVAEMPSFAASTYTISAVLGEAEDNDTKSYVALTIPTYTKVGDYWYKVTENNSNTAGVIYGTNDGTTETLTTANNAHDGIYYLHVQVTVDNDGDLVRTVTLHQDAPDAETSGSKVTDIENKYYAGQLQIVKELSGNAADPSDLFKVTVTFTKPADQEMKSDITYVDFLDSTGDATTTAASIGWTSGDTKAVEFYVKGGTTVTFSNIPYGVTYTVAEDKADGYSHSFAYDSEDAAASFDGITCAKDAVTEEGTTGTDDEKWAVAGASGSIADALDEVTITNTRNTTIDIGVVVNNAPYAAMLILAAGMLVVFLVRHRRMIEE